MVGWWRVVSASPSLKARLRELADEAAEGLAIELAGPKPDGPLRLTAGMIVLTVRTAREEALRLFERGASAKKANAAFLTLMERGFSAMEELVPSTALCDLRVRALDASSECRDRHRERVVRASGCCR